MKAKNKIISYLDQSNFSLIICEYKNLSEIDPFIKYLASRSVVISESTEEKIKDILINYKNQNVFLSEPINEWVLPLPKDNENMYLLKTGYWSRLVNEIKSIVVKNDLHLILLTAPYNSISPSNPSVAGDSSIIFSCDVVLHYHHNKFVLSKNRYGENLEITKDDLYKELPFIYRDKKLKRILK